MSLNLGPPAFDAIQTIKHTREWQIIREGLQMAFEQAVHRSIEAPPEIRLDATGYARALRDIVVALELNEGGPSVPRNYKPPVGRAPR